MEWAPSASVAVEMVATPLAFRLPLPTLAAAGVDMSSPEPIERTLRLFAKRVDELEALLAE